MKGIKLIDIPLKHDSRGNLAVVEKLKELPFDPKRIFWIFGVPDGETRASHAHTTQQQFIVAVSGSFTVETDDGKEKVETFMDSPDKGLLIDSGIWITLKNFSSDGICLAIAPDSYKKEEYINDYKEFLARKKNSDI